MTTQSGCLVKRGYLFDKKGILDRKRWYVLRHDVTHGSCLIEIYKDEKAATRMDFPKGFINVHDVVEVHRIVDRKQSFEVLCPGLGYRFMANSDLEADEWVQSIRGLILYRREPAQATLPPCLHTQPVAIAPPLHRHTLPSSSSSSLPDSNSLRLSRSPSYPLHANLPTPPDLATSPAAMPTCRSMRRGSSGELMYSFPPPPSPPSSSSGSSMASGSNASYDQPPSAVLPESDTDFRFRVQVKESEGLPVSGPADLVLGETTLALCSPDTGHLLVSWPISSLRRFGVNNVSITIMTGRNCSTGERKYQFYTQHSRRVYSHLHAISKAAAAKTHPLRRTGSEPPALVSCASTQYSHIEHPLTHPTTNEEYSQLNLSKLHPADAGSQSLTSTTLC